MKAKNLPVYQQKDKILEALKEHSVIIVQSPTGSGKTTQLPVILHEAGYTKQGIVGVTQPRRIATLSISDFMAKQLGCPLGDLVGYKMRFEDKTSNKTALKIMTDGILLQEIKSDPYLHNYSVIMVDEAHERSLNIDFILGLLKQILSVRSDFKVIISSATINSSVFSSYFNNAPTVTIETQTYPVGLFYDCPTDETEQALTEKIIAVTDRIIMDEKRAGDILVFLQGEKAIKETIKALYQGRAKKKVWPIPLYGMLGKEEQEKVFLKPPFGKTKVVVSTNIAETSITIDGVTSIIDSGRSKENRYNSRNFTSSLLDCSVSKASANQRKGRAGRTGPGFCYRLYSKSNFDSRPEFTTEEIYRTDLSEVVLRMAGLGITDFTQFDFISKPNPSGIIGGIETLKLLGALDAHSQLTRYGEIMLHFPLLPRHARIIVEAMQHHPDVLVECCIITAFLSTNSPYLYPQDEEVEARQAQNSFKGSHGDFSSYINLFNAFTITGDKEKFCTTYYLDQKTLEEIVNVEEQLEEVARSFGVFVGQGGKVEDYLMCCGKGLIQFVCALSGREIYESSTADRIVIHPSSTLFKANEPFMIAGEITQTTRLYARSVSPITRELVERISPLLAKQLHSITSRQKNRKVVAPPPLEKPKTSSKKKKKSKFFNKKKID